jgi:hypothetical protein
MGTLRGFPREAEMRQKIFFLVVPLFLLGYPLRALPAPLTARMSGHR